MILSFLKRKNAAVPESEAVQAIEDAILLGHVKELDEVLALIKNDGRFSKDIQHGLETLRYFRAYYGKDGELEPAVPLQKQKAIVLEKSFAAELLEKLRAGRSVAQKQA